jgi:formate/nitrite transporter
VLAGAFIALGALFATTVAAGTGDAWPYGVTRLLTGVAFSLGLILVSVGGAELFTGNNLIVMAWASRRVSTAALLRNWAIVYAGNLAGALGTAVLVFLGRQYTFGGGAVGATALRIAQAKVGLEFTQAIALAVLCNALVCLAVWMTFSARSTTDRVAAILFPISAFVAAGFEHSVANMYFVPVALLIRDLDPAFVAAAPKLPDLSGLTWGSFLVRNLLPVTIGNLIGGALLVALVYWSIDLRPTRGKPEATAPTPGSAPPAPDRAHGA